MSEVVIDVIDPPLVLSVCRICLGSNGGALESPCSCSGTIKFAHRECVQRWCDEKGDTTCEICLQKFEPGYTCPPKKAVSAREPTTRHANAGEGDADAVEAEPVIEHSHSSGGTAASCSRNLAIIVNVLLLILNMSAVFDSPSLTCSLPVVAVLAARAFGIILPMYVLFKFASRIENSIRQCCEAQNAQDDEESQQHPLNTQLHRH